MLPFQGGTNGKVIAEMYDILRKEGKQQFLKAYFHTAKDKDVPIDAAQHSRNCHSRSSLDSYPSIELTQITSVKFASFDGQVAMMGNGNQGVYLRIDLIVAHQRLP
jgi:hypothetical protein